VVALLLVGVCAACQAPPTQQVPLHLEPSGVRIFVDGTEIAGSPAELDLRSDRPHVVHLERDGYRAQQVVLESRASRLEPAEIRLTLAPEVPTERQIRIEGAEVD
jgi:hypothetical protein